MTQMSKMQKDPGISVIVPVYNIEEYLSACIESILAQTFTDFECILIDDASTDASGRICDDFAKRDARIKVIHNQKNMGSSLNRKRGFEQSNGRYIQFIDGDDWIECDMLEKMYTAVTSDDYDVAYCDFYSYNDSGRRHYHKIFEIGSSVEQNMKEWMLDMSKSCCQMWNKLIRRDIVSGIRFSEYSFCEDIYFVTQLLCIIKKSIPVKEALYHYCFNQNSISRKGGYKQQQKRYMEFIKNGMYIAEYLKPIYSAKNIQVSWGGGDKTFDLEIVWAEFLQALKPRLNVFFKRLVKWALPYGFVRFIQKWKR